MNIYDDIKISPLPNNRYILLEDFYYKDITVPAGYITNGADIPRILWSIWPPNKSDYMPAIIIHDYLTDMYDFERAHVYFKDIMQELNINIFTRWWFYNFTKSYLRIKYLNHKHI